MSKSIAEVLEELKDEVATVHGKVDRVLADQLDNDGEDQSEDFADSGEAIEAT